MNKSLLLIIFSSLILLGGILGIGLFRLSPKDFQSYEKLIESSSRPQKKTAFLAFSEQQRKEVTKEAWLQEETPLHLIISCKESDLFFFHGTGHETELVEEMRDVKGLMQEELFFQFPDGKQALLKGEGKYLLRGHSCQEKEGWVSAEKIKEATPYQIVRYFEADLATYHYNSHCLNAKDVKIRKYQLEGHQLPKDPISSPALMSGIAERVEFLLKNESMNFTAYQWKMSFDSEEGGI